VKDLSKAYVLLVNESGADNSVISNLKMIDSVKEAYGAFGAYDIITKLKDESFKKIEQDISKKIRTIPKVRSTLTLQVYEKESFCKINEIENEILDQHMSKAFSIIRCKTSNEIPIMQELKKIPEIIEADVVIGSFEILCKIFAPTYNEISEIITNKIRKIPNIQSTITLNVIENQGFRR